MKMGTIVQDRLIETIACKYKFRLRKALDDVDSLVPHSHYMFVKFKNFESLTD